MVNLFKIALKSNENFKKRYIAFFQAFCEEVYEQLLTAVKERTPVDQGALRAAFQTDSTMAINGNTATITVHNSESYASHIEWGYQQKPGMILKMRMEAGRLRFVEFLGYSFAYGKGDPTGKQEPDEDGNYTIVTRKRDIPGVHMLKDSMDELAKTLPALYAKRFAAFKRSTPWI